MAAVALWGLVPLVVALYTRDRRVWWATVVGFGGADRGDRSQPHLSGRALVLRRRRWSHRRCVLPAGSGVGAGAPPPTRPVHPRMPLPPRPRLRSRDRPASGRHRIPPPCWIQRVHGTVRIEHRRSTRATTRRRRTRLGRPARTHSAGRAPRRHLGRRRARRRRHRRTAHHGRQHRSSQRRARRATERHDRRRQQPKFNFFFGAQTKRFTDLIVASPTFRDVILQHPVIIGLADRVMTQLSDSYWLNTTQIIEIRPATRARCCTAT